MQVKKSRMIKRYMRLSKADPEIMYIIEKERERQKNVLQMIPSENYTSQAVREAVGSILMNKYAEGQVGKRYYQGNENIDKIEEICKKRALRAFSLSQSQWGVNVQALSGSPANLAVYNALLKPKDKIMAMFLPDGGHLSHGWQLPGKKVTLVSKIWNIVFYHVDRNTKVFDYNKIEEQAKKEKPKLLISGGTAYPREIDHKKMGHIASSVGGYYMADIAHEAGLVAAGVNHSPFPYAHMVTMTTHKTLRGPRGAIIFSRKDISPLINSSVFPGLQGGPHEHTIAGIAVALKESQTQAFKKYAKQVLVNADLLARIFIKEGFDVVSGGTDKHLILIDLRNKGIVARIAALALEYAGIVVNYNTVPQETGSSVYPSGIRMGTPAITTRGMKEREMKVIASWIIQILTEVSRFKLPENKKARPKYIENIKVQLSKQHTLRLIAKQVKELCNSFPTP